MTKRISALFLTISILFTSASTIAAQTKRGVGSWEALNSYLNNEVAAKAEDRKTVFGVLTSVDANVVTVQTSDQNNVTEVLFRREEVEKIWLAKLNISSRKTLIGAGVGAGIGVGIGAIALKNSDERGGAYGAAVPFYAVCGALVGGVAGFFVRQKNKKERLIFQK